MRKIVLGLCLALALPGCAGGLGVPNIPPSPAAVADQTKVDEVGVIALANSVHAAADLATLAIRTRVCRGECVQVAKKLSGVARLGLTNAERAYKAANASSYAAAAAQVNSAVASLRKTISGDSQ